MSRIIKQSEVDVEEVDSYVHETFAMPVVETDGDYTEDAEPIDPEEERAAILAAARDEAEVKVREAYEEGYRRGEQKAIDEFQARAGEATQVFEQAAEAVRLARENFMEQLAPQVVSIARAVSERVALRECQSDPDLIARVAREALGHVASSQTITIIVNPEDMAIVQEHKPELIEAYARIEEIHLVADDSIERGGCQIDAQSTIVDASFQAMIERALEALDG